MVTSLYNIPYRYLGRYYKIFHCFGITHKHTCKIISFLFCFKFGLQPCQYLFHHFPELHQKSEHFWTLLNPSPSSNPFELNSNEFEFKSFNHGLSIFLRTRIFLRVRENYPHAQIISPTLSLSPFSFFAIYCFW